MSDIRFRCLVCKGKLSVDTTGGGQNVTCPKCESRIMIPRHSTLPPRIGSTRHSATEALQAEISRLSTELDALNKGAPADGELVELRAKLESSEADRQKLEEQLTKLRDDSEKMHSASAATDAVREEVRKERELRKRLEQEFDVTRQRLDREIEALKESQQKQAAESDRREKKLQENLDAAKRELEKHSEESNSPDANEISEEVRKQLEQAESERKKADQEASDAQKELDAQRQKLTEAIASSETAEAAWQKSLQDQNRQKESLSREHEKEVEKLSRDLESARKSLDEGEKKLARERTSHQAREKQLKKQGKSVQILVKEESAAQGGRPTSDSVKPPVAKRKETQKQEEKQPEPAPAILTTADAIATPPMSGLLVLGWLSLLAGIGAAIAVPHAFNLTTGAIGAALLIGVIVLLRRRTPLVFGLIVLSVLMPPMLAVGVGLGYRGIFPLSTASSALVTAPEQAGKPPELSIPENTPRTRVGESAIVDEVEITFDGVRIGPVMVRAFIDDDVAMLEGEFLIVDLTLKNMAEDRPLHLDNPWERSRISDSYSEFYVIDQQRQGLEHVEGTLGSMDLKPGVAMSDMIVFAMPDEQADEFHFLADPGFSTLRSDGMFENVSSDTLRLWFKRSAFQVQN